MPLNAPFGFVDIPLSTVGQDQLSATPYYEGLAEYVRRCSTPMTVAIQGDWGTGKSTALNFLAEILTQEELPNQPYPQAVKVIELNTWQYSQFKFDEILTASLINEMLDSLTPHSYGQTEAIGRLKRGFSALFSAALSVGASAVPGGTFVEPALRAMIEPSNSTATSAFKELQDLKINFTAAVKDYCDSENFDRVVILIDDLDRVEPKRAIEILESLKLFFEVPRCVFVLAIDFDVVVRGVRDKYGHDFDEEKARQFFDKIIQVPFSMPVTNYDVRKLLYTALDRADIPVEQRRPYLTTVLNSVGTNPRSLKRLFNSFELLQLILASQRRSIADSGTLVFALLCAQIAYPNFHRQLIRANSEQLEQLFATDDGEDVFKSEDFGVNAAQSQAFKDFHQTFGNLASDSSGTLEAVRLFHAIKITQVTSIADESASAGEKAISEELTRSQALEIVHANTKEATGRYLNELFKGMETSLQNRPWSMRKQESGNLISLYSTDYSSIKDAAGRARPRFAAITFSRRGLTIPFGVALPEPREDGRRYEAHWDELVSHLQSLNFQTKDSGVPLQLTVTSIEEAKIAAQYLRQIYDIYLAYHTPGARSSA